MARREQPLPSTADGVGISFAVAVRPSRSAAFRAAITAILHAGFGFGRDVAGRMIYTFDAAGEHYGDATLVPAGSLKTLAEARERLLSIASYHNQSFALSFSVAHRAVAVHCRVYDEPGLLVFHLDFGATSWRSLVNLRRSPEVVTHGLIDAGRILFTLLPVQHVLIGPSALLDEIPASAPTPRLRAVPVAMLAQEAYLALPARSPRPLYREQLPRGWLLIRGWDASHPAIMVPRASGSQRRRSQLR